MTTELTEARLLDIWEAGAGQRPPDRALLLGALADGPDPAVPLANRPLGELNALLLELRERCFGTALPCATDCPRCEEQLDVIVTTSELRALRPSTPVPVGALHLDGREVAYRALTAADLLAVDPDAPDARSALVRRCLVGGGAAGDAVLEAVAERLAALDPGADTAVALACPYCRHSWSAAFDLAGYLWTEVEAYARRLLHEVHQLAREYGWTEAEVLGVSPTRRQYYLEAAAG
ncbi:hypothetical protein STRCI_001097 [Streptomyces cinnabarinus]|uniref:Phage baseplate protein n=1 Tax=Streptomyces cinnabarinus TaxID=67287 RepID=A0ABY7K9M0_9ACTN|nr:hypothetical protein [Streptomyces cinnabarinus]WAZ20007.1 hypothetical protein STRCI_001097 [Streptomyces cinnabarinus]